MIVGTSTYSVSGVFSDVLIGAGFLGCDSTVTTDLTVMPAVVNSQTVTVCAGESVTVGTSTHSTSGIFSDVLIGAGFMGCDSTVNTDLTVKPAIDLSVTVIAETIELNTAADAYQWIDCNNSNAIVAGENGINYSATTNGNYAVVVTSQGCSDTSVCSAITTIGILQTAAAKDLVNVYPNPNNGSFVIKSTTEGSYVLINSLGQTVQTITLTAPDNYSFTINSLEGGVYFIKNNKGTLQYKIVVTN